MKVKQRNIIYKTIVWIATIITSVVFLLPIYWIFLSSITPREMIFTSPIHYIPLQPTLANYTLIFETLNFWKFASNTAVILSFSLLASTLFSVLAAYAFARIKFRGSNIALMFIFLSSILPMATTVIPLFQMFNKFDLIDKMGGMFILYTSMLLPFSTWIITSYLKQFPLSLEEAAWIDGSGFFRSMITIILPLMRPAVATILIINFITGMNEFMTPLIFSMQETKTLTVGMLEIASFSPYYAPWENISAYGSLMLIPIILFIIIFQKQIMEGLMSGGVKS
ncbi:MAG: carbohydrate ABC transporter permease [Saccharofermentanales bacterium]